MNFTRVTEEAMVMMINPELASELLAQSAGNRRTRKWYVEHLAGVMRRGEWRVTSQGIGIDIFGHLRDGHHRLMACIQSGVTIKSIVVMGLRVDAYQVIDIGMKRNLGDLLGTDEKLAQIYSYVGSLFFGGKAGTVDQLRPIIYESGLHEAAVLLLEYCNSSVRYFSCAAIKTAACAMIMNGGNSDFILKQYRALVLKDFDNMTQSAVALCRQEASGRAKTKTDFRHEALARGLRVFDQDRANISRIQVSDADIASAPAFVRSVINEGIAKGNNKIITLQKTA